MEIIVTIPVPLTPTEPLTLTVHTGDGPIPEDPILAREYGIKIAEHYARYIEILRKAVTLIYPCIASLGGPLLTEEEVQKKAVDRFFARGFEPEQQQTNKTSARKHGQEVLRAVSFNPNLKLSLPPIIPLKELSWAEPDHCVFSLLREIAREGIPRNEEGKQWQVDCGALLEKFGRWQRHQDQLLRNPSIPAAKPGPKPKKRRPDVRGQILGLLREHPDGLTTPEIARRLNKRAGSFRTILRRLQKEGQVVAFEIPGKATKWAVKRVTQI